MSLPGESVEESVTWEDIKCLTCRYAKKCCLGMLNVTYNCWKDINVSSLNEPLITCILLIHQEENTGDPLPAGQSGFWIMGESSDLIFFLTTYLVKSHQILILLFIIGLNLISEFILFASQVIKLQAECGEQAYESIQVSPLRYVCNRSQKWRAWHDQLQRIKLGAVRPPISLDSCNTLNLCLCFLPRQINLVIAFSRFLLVFLVMYRGSIIK